ncbi:MAG: zinc ABC transporter substrate-binding protein [Desulfobacteraceae bacterium]
MSRKIGVLLVLFAAVSGTAAFPCSAGEPMQVFVSILPQKYFVERIGGRQVNVNVMVRPGENPAVYEPGPGQMVALTESSIYFAVGVPFERTWLGKISSANPDMRIVHTDADIRKFPMEGRHSHAEDGDGHDNADGNDAALDPHVWMSPPLVMLQARRILTALEKADPENSKLYENNYKEFIRELVDLDGDIRSLFREKEGMRFMVFHPSWGYFARAYGLVQIPVELEGKSIKPSRLVKLIKKGKKLGIDAVFIQPQFSRKSAEIVAGEIEGGVVQADPLAENWEENLRAVAERFREALK